MKLKYTLKNSIGKAEENVVFKADDILTIEFESLYVLRNLLVSITDGSVKKQIRCLGNAVNIPKDLVKAGTLCFDVSLIERGQIVKTFVCEPLTIVEHNGELYSHKAYKAIREELVALNIANKELTKTLNSVLARLEKAEKQVQEIWENEEK